jgi:hypothetical protein
MTSAPSPPPPALVLLAPDEAVGFDRPEALLRFTAAAAPSTERVALWPLRENTPEATETARAKIRPALLDGRPVELDFARIDLCAQSWLHALLFEPMRLAWAMRVPIHVVNADPAVREGLRFLEAYALGG